MLLLFRHNGENNSNRGFMVNQSLRSRLMFMAALPALLAALWAELTAAIAAYEASLHEKAYWCTVYGVKAYEASLHEKA